MEKALIALGLDVDRLRSCATSDAVAAVLRTDRADAVALQVTGTPTFFVGTIEGPTVRLTSKISGAQPPEIFRAVLDELLGR